MVSMIIPRRPEQARPRSTRSQDLWIAASSCLAWCFGRSVSPRGAAQPPSAVLLAYRNGLGQTGGTGR